MMLGLCVEVRRSIDSRVRVCWTLILAVYKMMDEVLSCCNAGLIEIADWTMRKTSNAFFFHTTEMISLFFSRNKQFLCI